jgi:hypothetical protein
MPTHKLTASLTLHPVRKVSFTPYVVVRSETWAHDLPAADGSARARALPASVRVNAWLHAEDVLVSGVDVGVGVFDLLDDPYAVAQPYADGHGVMPLASLEVAGKLTYRFPL